MSDPSHHRASGAGDRVGAMSILDANPTTPEAEAIEREVYAQDPRPGVWAGENGADLRALTQEETDLLIRFELIAIDVTLKNDQIVNACGYGSMLDVKAPILYGRDSVVRPRVQRGGIDSDPLVRVLANRAWGDRDRKWFEMRGVRAGEVVRTYVVGGVAWVERCMSGEMANPECASRDARPGEEITVGDRRYRVSDRLREPPDWLEQVRADVQAFQDANKRLPDRVLWQSEFNQRPMPATAPVPRWAKRRDR